MKIIKKLGCLDKKRSFGLFLCPYCNEEVVLQLSNGKTYNSCGCKHYYLSSINQPNFKHGCRKERIYHTWKAISQRCNNKNNPAYKRYGGRGITICDSWKKDFLLFKKWALLNGYKENLFIDRIDNNGDYEPNNCRWVTAKQNNRNKNCNKLSELKAQEIIKKYIPRKNTIKMLAKEYGVSCATIYNIISKRIWL